MNKKLNNREDLLSWVKHGLHYFYNIPYVDSLKIKFEMITEVDDRYSILLNNQSYCLPKVDFQNHILVN